MGALRPARAATSAQLALALGLLNALPVISTQHPRPFCRKSPELHAVVPMDSEPGCQHEDVIAFGGKGFFWAEKGQGAEEFVEDDDDWEVEEREDLEISEGMFDDGDVDEEEDTASSSTGRRLAKVADMISIMRRRRSLKKRVDFFGDTWMFSLKSGSWLRVDVGSESPPKRWKPSSSIIEDRRAIVMFGGCRTTHMAGVMNDLWVFRLESSTPAKGNWTRVETKNPPIARRGHIAVANTTHFVILGGKGLTMRRGKGGKGGKGKERLKPTALVDLWALPLSALMEDAPQGEAEWVQGKAFPGHPRWGATGTLMYKDGHQVLALFGGRNKNPGHKKHERPEEEYTYFNELWLYDFVADSWERAEAVSSGYGLPHPRDHHGATSLNGDLFIFGGRISEAPTASSVLNDLWSYSLSAKQWTRHDSSSEQWPVNRFMSGITAVQPGDQHFSQGAVVIFGGEHLPGTTIRSSLNGVWGYSLLSGAWETLSPTDCSAEAVGVGDLGEVEEPEAASFRATVTTASALIAVVGGALWFFAIRKPASARVLGAEPSEQYSRL